MAGRRRREARGECRRQFSRLCAKLLSSGLLSIPRWPKDSCDKRKTIFYDTSETGGPI